VYLTPASFGGEQALPSHAALRLAANLSCTQTLTLDGFTLPAALTGHLPFAYFVGYTKLSSLSLINIAITAITAGDLQALGNLTTLCV
jgi:hypothetical protein